MEVLNLNRHHLRFLISVEQESEVCPERWDGTVLRPILPKV